MRGMQFETGDRHQFSDFITSQTMALFHKQDEGSGNYWRSLLPFSAYTNTGGGGGRRVACAVLLICCSLASTV
jgi:hypothetical protein